VALASTNLGRSFGGIVSLVCFLLHLSPFIGPGFEALCEKTQGPKCLPTVLCKVPPQPPFPDFLSPFFFLLSGRQGPLLSSRHSFFLPPPPPPPLSSTTLVRNDPWWRSVCSSFRDPPRNFSAGLSSLFFLPPLGLNRQPSRLDTRFLARSPAVLSEPPPPSRPFFSPSDWRPAFFCNFLPPFYFGRDRRFSRAVFRCPPLCHLQYWSGCLHPFSFPFGGSSELVL